MIFRKIIIFSQLLSFFFSLYCKNIIDDSIAHDVKKLSFTKNTDGSQEFKILDTDYDHDNIIVYKFLDQQKSSYIVFIKNNENYHYIVKQDKGKALKNQFRSLCETLCAYIAQKLSIPSHNVRLLPIAVAFPGKFMTKRIATLHTVVPGNTIRTLVHEEYSKLDIKQSTDNNLPFEQQGFNERTITSMSLHPQLSRIVALDTFIGNKDRNKANLLYDNDTDSFYVIDMSLMYDILNERKSVAKLACDQITAMIEKRKKFTQRELEALTIYRSTLQELVHNFPPQKMNDLLDLLVIESGLLSDKSCYDAKEVHAFINTYKRLMKQSYIDIKKLIYLSFILINN